MAKNKLGRNEPCHCGSGRKYKNCHYNEDREKNRLPPPPVDAATTNNNKPKVVYTPPPTRNDAVVLLAVAGTIVAAAVGLAYAGYVNWGLAMGIGGLALLGVYIVLRDPPPPRDDPGNPAGLNFGG